MKKLTLLIAQLILMVSCAKNGSDEPDSQTTTVSFSPDTETVLRNPCTGWAIYTDGYIPTSASAYFSKMENCGALEYASILYIRLPWALLEPEEGKYAWDNNKEFQNLIQGAIDRNIKLAFRVYTENKDYSIRVTPQYVKDAGAEGFTANTGLWTPYADDPIFLEKLDSFIAAMGKRFNNPAITDFVDGFGLGTWGEGFDVVCKNPANKNSVLYTVTQSYAKHFSNVLCVINAHSAIGNAQLSELATTYDYNFRHDAVGSKVWFEASQSGLMLKFFPEYFTVAENMWWFSQGTSTDIYKGEGFNNWREVLDFTYSEAERIHANVLDLRNCDEAKLLWMKLAPDLVEAFNANAGYRLAPFTVQYSPIISRGCETVITHIWQNLGWGVCPNNNSHWGYKYKVAFALLSRSTNKPVEIIFDEEVEPSEWLGTKKQRYHSYLVFNSPAGEYTLAVGIVDTSLEENPIGIKLAVKDQNQAYEGWLPIGDIKIK